MDWYLIGRILGVVYWPALAAVVVYGIGWAIATSRPEHLAEGTKHWARVAAVVGFGATLFVTLREFVK